VASPEIFAEWEETAHKQSVVDYFARRGVDVREYQEVIADLWNASEAVHPSGEPPPCRDEKDRKYLHCAVEGGVDLLISTDQDLLVIGQLANCLILTPGAAWARLAPLDDGTVQSE